MSPTKPSNKAVENKDIVIEKAPSSPIKKSWMKGSFQLSPADRQQKNGQYRPPHLMKFWVCSVTGLILLRLIDPIKGPNEQSFTHNLNSLYAKHNTLKNYFIGEYIAGRGYDRLMDNKGAYAQNGFVFKQDEVSTEDVVSFIKTTLVPAIQEVNICIYI